MTEDRYNQLQWDPSPQRLTDDEIEEGWHWCLAMDDLLCIYGSDDCFCAPENPAHKEEIEKEIMEMYKENPDQWPF